MSLLDVAGLSFAYPSREPAVKEVSFTVAAGEHLGIVGPNGAGKSTLLRLLGGLLRPGVGTIRYDVDKKRIDRFEGVALGLHWGAGPYTGGARPGRTPLGIAFELARGDAPADLVPPQGSREWKAYLQAEGN